jgi:uncharacterized membrane protein YhhN
MNYFPLIGILALAVLDWIAAEKKIRPLEYFAKPATMLALLAWMWASVGLDGAMLWFIIGAIFCLVGDIFLMLPGDLFIFGLLSFLFGHIFYIIGLNNSAPYFSLRGGIIIVFLVIYIGWLYTRLARGLRNKGKKILQIPVAIYGFVISLMVYSALMSWSRPAWPVNASILVSIGAMLFYISDSLLAWDRFINSIGHARLKVMITYHLGQIGIILGAMLFILNQ